MNEGGMAALVATGLVTGWNVAWIPGPINVEIARRGVTRGFGPAFLVGVGASSGDFAWALVLTTGLGAAAATPAVRATLGPVSVALLAGLGLLFLVGAWRYAKATADGGEPPVMKALDSKRGSLVLGFTMAVTSPFNVAFWLGMIGRGTVGGLSGGAALVFAGSVVAGALTWCLVLCLAVMRGARTPSRRWEIGTRVGAGLLMLGFAVHLATRLV